MNLWSNQLDAERRVNVAANFNKEGVKLSSPKPKCQDGS
jgi:hypothetical protein